MIEVDLEPHLLDAGTLEVLQQHVTVIVAAAVDKLEDFVVGQCAAEQVEIPRLVGLLVDELSDVVGRPGEVS